MNVILGQKFIHFFCTLAPFGYRPYHKALPFSRVAAGENFLLIGAELHIISHQVSFGIQVNVKLFHKTLMFYMFVSERDKGNITFDDKLRSGFFSPVRFPFWSVSNPFEFTAHFLTQPSSWEEVT